MPTKCAFEAMCKESIILSTYFVCKESLDLTLHKVSIQHVASLTLKTKLDSSNKIHLQILDSQLKHLIQSLRCACAAFHVAPVPNVSTRKKSLWLSFAALYRITKKHRTTRLRQSALF